MLDTCDLIPGFAIVLSDLGLDNYLWIELAWNDEIRRLIEARNSLRSFSLPVTDTSVAEHILDSGFQVVANQF